MRLFFICSMCVVLVSYLESASNTLLRIEKELKQLRSDIAKQSAPTNATPSASASQRGGSCELMPPKKCLAFTPSVDTNYLVAVKDISLEDLKRLFNAMAEEELKSIENAYEIDTKDGKMLLTADVEEWKDEKGKFKIDNYAKPRNFSYGVLIQDEFGNPKNHPDEDLYDSRHNIWFHRALLRKQKYGKQIPIQQMENENKGIPIQTITNLTDSAAAVVKKYKRLKPLAKSTTILTERRMRDSSQP